MDAAVVRFVASIILPSNSISSVGTKSILGQFVFILLIHWAIFVILKICMCMCMCVILNETFSIQSDNDLMLNYFVLIASPFYTKCFVVGIAPDDGVTI